MRSWWILLLAVGCDDGTSGGKPTVIGQTPVGTSDPTTTGHDGFQPYAFAVTAATFGLDADALEVVSVTGTDASGAPVDLPISVTVLVTDVSGAQTGTFTDENHCTVVLENDGPLPYAAWTGDAGAWFGFEIASATGTTDCGALDFPPEWGENPVEHVTKWIWGAGINPLTEDTIDLLGAVYPQLAPWIVGSGYHWEDLAAFTASENQEEYEDGYIDVGFAYAYEVDEMGALVVDGAGNPVLLPSDDVAASGNGATAWYELQNLRLLYPASVLLETP